MKTNDISRITCSINNIIYKDKKNGQRTSQLYGDFSLMYFNQQLSNISTSRFELDLKADPYGNKNALKAINQLEYTPSNSTFDFLKFDKTNNKYIKDELLSVEYKNALVNHDILNITLGTLLGLFAILLEFLILFISDFLFSPFFVWATLARCIIFVCYFLLGSFLYMYPWANIVPLFILIIILSKNKSLREIFKKRLTLPEPNEFYFEASI